MLTNLRCLLAFFICLHTYKECSPRAIIEDTNQERYRSNLIYGHIIGKIHEVINNRKAKNHQTYYNEARNLKSPVSSLYEQKAFTVRSAKYYRSTKAIGHNSTSNCASFKEFKAIKVLLGDVKKHLLNMENEMKDVVCIVKSRKTHHNDECRILAEQLKECKKNHRTHRGSDVDSDKWQSYNGWSPWTACSATCGYGKTLRMRFCKETKCDGADIVIEERLCRIANCE